MWNRRKREKEEGDERHRERIEKRTEEKGKEEWKIVRGGM